MPESESPWVIPTVGLVAGGLLWAIFAHGETTRGNYFTGVAVGLVVFVLSGVVGELPVALKVVVGAAVLFGLVAMTFSAVFFALPGLVCLGAALLRPTLAEWPTRPIAAVVSAVVLAMLVFGAILPTAAPSSIVVVLEPPSRLNAAFELATRPGVASIRHLGDAACIAFRDGATQDEVDAVAASIERIGGRVDQSRQC